MNDANNLHQKILPERAELYFRHFIDEVELMDFFKRLKEKNSQIQSGLIPTEDVKLK